MTGSYHPRQGRENRENDQIPFCGRSSGEIYFKQTEIFIDNSSISGCMHEVERQGRGNDEVVLTILEQSLSRSAPIPDIFGSTENAGPENGGPKKMKELKMQD